MSVSSLSEGYCQLVKNGASDNEICDFLDKKLGVKHESQQVVVIGNYVRCGDTVFEKESGKIAGYLGNERHSRPNSNRYCDVLTCATFECQQHF